MSGWSQQLILSQVHPLYDITAVIKYTANVVCIYCTCEMWIAIMSPITTGGADSQEFVTYKVLGSCDTLVFLGSDNRVRRKLIAFIGREVLFDSLSG